MRIIFITVIIIFLGALSIKTWAAEPTCSGDKFEMPLKEIYKRIVKDEMKRIGQPYKTNSLTVKLRPDIKSPEVDAQAPEYHPFLAYEITFKTRDGVEWSVQDRSGIADYRYNYISEPIISEATDTSTRFCVAHYNMQSQVYKVSDERVVLVNKKTHTAYIVNATINVVSAPLEEIKSESGTLESKPNNRSTR